jgi:hypothetical protein
MIQFEIEIQVQIWASQILTPLHPLASVKIAVSSRRVSRDACVCSVCFVCSPFSPLSGGDAEDMLGPRFPGNKVSHLLLAFPCTFYVVLSIFVGKYILISFFLFPFWYFHFLIAIMAGEVRQPIDIPSLERYIDQNVSEIKTPLDVKQVSLALCPC